MGKLFGTDGIRGRAGVEPVTVGMARRLGLALGKISGGFRGKAVAIGRDTRESGEALEKALAEGLMMAGADVICLGVVPTPALANAVASEDKVAAGVMLTASHNPYFDNGMKVFGADGFKLDDTAEEELEELLIEADLLKDSEGICGKIIGIGNYVETYRSAVKQSISKTDLSGLKLVMDAGNGAAYKIGPEIFRELGAEVVRNCVRAQRKEHKRSMRRFISGASWEGGDRDERKSWDFIRW